jgi:hypothetical protein
MGAWHHDGLADWLSVVMWLRLWHVKFKFDLYYDPWSVGHFILVLGPLWGAWPDFYILCLTITFFPFRVGRPLWREDESVICSAITHWLGSSRTHSIIFLPHPRLPQPGGPDPRIYNPRNRVAQSQSYMTTVSQSASPSWCQAPIWDPRQIFLSPWNFLLNSCGFCYFVSPFLTRGQVYNLLLLLVLASAVPLGSPLSDERSGLSFVSISL